jgi:hypothetical protein
MYDYSLPYFYPTVPETIIPVLRAFMYLQNNMSAITALLEWVFVHHFYFTAILLKIRVQFK